VLVGPKSTIRELKNLGGHTVKFSGPGAAVTLTAESVLSAFGLDPSEIIDPASGAGTDALAELLDGRLEVMVNLGAPPVLLVQQALAAGARLLPIEGEPIDRLVREYPFYSVMVIPADAYPGLAAPVVTIGVDGVLLARSDVPDETVYALTKTLYSGPFGVPADAALAQRVDVSVGAATPIPLHPGAARFYRERELSP
jgi:TRAP transporter TAXI family solute receptor